MITLFNLYYKNLSNYFVILLQFLQNKIKRIVSKQFLIRKHKKQNQNSKVSQENLPFLNYNAFIESFGTYKKHNKETLFNVSFKKARLSEKKEKIQNFS